MTSHQLTVQTKAFHSSGVVFDLLGLHYGDCKEKRAGLTYFIIVETGKR